MKKIVILGVTGSIGKSTLSVVRANPEAFKIVGVTGGKNWELMAEICAEFNPSLVAMEDVEAARLLATNISREVLQGEDGMVAAAEMPEADIVVSAIVGAAGLNPTLTALKSGKRVALANKEPLVMAGALVMKTARENNAEILPVDSEHSAIFQSLAGAPARTVNRIFLTASGGPFRNTPANEFANITPEMALNHPTWSMGKKITVDSATLMNKALEIIEAHWLFDVDCDKIEVVVHPQSIVHSMVEFTDSSIIAQLGVPSMELPIQYALTYPERIKGEVPRLDVTEVGRLTFEKPDRKKFPSLEFAYRASNAGGIMPAVMNAANEAAVNRFLEGKLSFPGIFGTIERCMDIMADSNCKDPGIEDIMNADEITRKIAAKEMAI